MKKSWLYAVLLFASMFMCSASFATPDPGINSQSFEKVMTAILDTGQVAMAGSNLPISKPYSCMACNSKTNTNKTKLVTNSGVSVPITAYIKPRELITYWRPNNDGFKVTGNKCGGSWRGEPVLYAGVLAA